MVLYRSIIKEDNMVLCLYHSLSHLTLTFCQRQKQPILICIDYNIINIQNVFLFRSWLSKCLSDDGTRRYWLLSIFSFDPPFFLFPVQEWLSMGSTLGQVALGQLAAVSSYSLDNMETRARCLNLMGKTLRLLAKQEDPIYVSSLWDRELQVDNINVCLSK